MAVQVRGEILDVRRAGAYHVLSLTAPGISENVKPGHFLTLGIGGEESSMLLRRAFAIHRVQSRGVYGGTLDIVVGVHGKGTKWLVDRRRHDPIDIVGPLGRPFVLPKEPVSTVLVGGGYGSAPLFMLAEQMRERGCRVDVILGAATEEKLYGALELKRLASTLTITTDDGSLGQRGRVTDVLGSLMQANDTAVVYACGPMPMLQRVAEIASDHQAYSQCAVEEAMACGIGVCMTCVLPVIGEDGVTRMLRACTEGPVFRGDRVRWSDVGTIPPDTLGAPTAGGH
ncbi:MAG: dihydroorotate dehydrogenase electron transfer subunit [Candidatus Nanopelagicales bacterium]|nr:dihydroorotate dehydrogenase electron transfer subunit [Candidatus Nanopelagicales bacterium]MCF8538501.1 dihydroorotate dehydrogenase electron transfer subunit [Candidatus Nanopelagicales bacterium]MCF8542614.1 dihydroorotate dehydrogenase electron transfer subunit [Candidatus Nanopelagicales bacterium]MCF8558091.1 dihydroorotate dehydrogenase electron transfer subunit [Candidatus Nanopelagicales bacterium]